MIIDIEKDLGATGYTDPNVTSPILCDTQFAEAIDRIKASGRAGVIQLPAKTFYTSVPIQATNVPGLEIRGIGGHRRARREYTDQWLEELGAGSVIRQTDETQHIVSIKTVTQGHDTSLRLKNIMLRGYVANKQFNPSNAAGVFIDDSETWMAGIEFDNVFIREKTYGIRTNIHTNTLKSKGVGLFEIHNSDIADCFWGVLLDGLNGTNTTIRFRDSSIRSNGIFYEAEANYDSEELGGGILLRKCSNPTIVDCTLEANSTGIRMHYCKGGKVSGNYFERNSTCAINAEDCAGIDMGSQYSSVQQPQSNLVGDLEDHAHLIRLKNCESIGLDNCYSRQNSGHSDVAFATVVDAGGNKDIGGNVTTPNYVAG